MQTQKPIIGIILDWEEQGSFSDFPYFALRTHYIDAIRICGGTPWLIPYGEIDSVDEYLDMIDGLLIPGGFYAMPNNWYLDAKETSPYTETPRFKFEQLIITKALKKDLPILGICAGMQVLAGLFNAKLAANVNKALNSSLEHFDLTKPHKVVITPNSLLHNITGKNEIMTNSHHREIVVKTEAPIIVAARSEDGAIEAIEFKNAKFVIGLQWHPEMLCYQNDQLNEYNPHHLIFRKFIDAASN